MTGRDDWRRVSKRYPCPICDKADWCAVSVDGSVALCKRIESPKLIGEAGWLHRLQDGERTAGRSIGRLRFALPSSDGANLDGLNAKYRASVTLSKLERLSHELGVSVESLQRLGVGWCGWGWTFPMTEASGKLRGIRVRKRNGIKLAVTGSRDGLFIPDPRDDLDMLGALDTSSGGVPPLLICEGPTDTAAMLDLGFDAVGRPSCRGGSALLVDLVRRRRPSEVVIVSDGDGPGSRGAETLASVLVVHAPAVRVVRPPIGIKDARAWKRAGATTDLVVERINAAEARQLNIRISQRKVQHGCSARTRH